MIDNEDDIERYLLGKMSGEEFAEFEIQFSLNPELKAELEKQRLIMLAIQESRKEELRAYLSEHINKDETPVIPLWQRGYVKIAAGLAIAASIAVIIYSNHSVREIIHVSNDNLTASTKHEDKDSENKTDSSLLEEIAKADSSNPKPYDSDLADVKHGKSVDSISLDGSSDADNSIAENITKSNEKSLEEFDKKAMAKDENAPTLMDSISHDKILKDTTVIVSAISPNTYATNAGASLSGGGKSGYKNQDVTTKSLAKEKKSVVAKPSAPLKSETSPLINKSDNSDIPGTIEIEYWESAIHYKGYRFFRNVLQLYGVKTNERVQVFKLEGNYYLKTSKGVFNIKEQNDYNSFIIIKNREITDKLK